MKLPDMDLAATASSASPADVRQIAVLRANAVGDYIITLPALQALRDTFTHARIVLLGKAWHADFLRGRAGPVDEVMVLPEVPGITVAAEQAGDQNAIANFCARACERHFDLAMQLHGGGRYSNPFVKRLGARQTAGFATPDSEKLDHSFSYQVLQPQILHMLECVGTVGARTHSAQPHLTLRSQDLQEAAAVCPPSEQPLVIMQPGASDARKCWSPQNFARVADHFAASGARVAVNGTRHEGACVRAVIDNMRYRDNVIDLTDKLSVGGLAGLVSRARLMVSNDTGPVHLARALGVANVTVIWLGNLTTYGPLSSAASRVAVSWRMDCPVCGHPSVGEQCAHQASFVDDVSVEEVLAHAVALYDTHSTPLPSSIPST